MKTIKLFFLFFLILHLAKLNAEWLAMYPTTNSGYNKATIVTTDNAGNIYVTGQKQTSVGYPIYYTITTLKYSTGGVKLWEVSYNLPYGYAIPCAIKYFDVPNSETDLLYVTGGIIDLEDPNNDFRWNIITLSYTTDGDENWANKWSDHYQRNDNGYDIDCDISGNVYIAGESNGWYEDPYGIPHDFNFTVLKYSINGGNPEWIHQYSNGNDNAYGIKVRGNFVYATGKGHNGSNYDFRTMAFSLNGTYLWQSLFNNDGEDIAYDIATNFSGIYVTGSSYSGSTQKTATIKYNFDGIRQWMNNEFNGVNYTVQTFDRRVSIGNGPEQYTTDVFTTGYGINSSVKCGQTIRYTTTGGISWRRIFESNNPVSFCALEIDNNENIFVTGNELNGSSEPISGYTIKYEYTVGFALWTENLKGSYTQVDLRDIAIDINGDPIVIGKVTPSTPNNTFYITMKYNSTDGGGDYFVKDKDEIYSLSQNYPNPFNPSTQIKFSIPKSSFVTLKIYDILGREIKELLNEFKEAGNYNVTFDGSNLSSGMYFYKLIADDYTDIKRMTLIK
ncbi:MAG: T9SS C-terminal target domain-containing protein [Ignavibacteriae bacterium]|nr:MAG: T9SS C-terminal target domain-containing protein [Ignavibacteriota bacterium]